MGAKMSADEAKACVDDLLPQGRETVEGACH